MTETTPDPAPPPAAWQKTRLPHHWWSEIAAALHMQMRLPFLPKSTWDESVYRAAIVWFPLIGVLVGLFGATVEGLSSWWGLPPFVTAPLTIMVMIWITGAYSEGGLANLADGLGGGATRDDKLRIMADSRIGTYGTLALITTFALRAGAVMSFSSSPAVFAALIAASAVSRALMAAGAAWLDPARADDPIARISEPTGVRLVVGLALAAALALMVLGPQAAAAACGAGMGGALLVMLVAKRQLGGYTRDVLAGVQQVAEILVLLMLVTLQE